MARDIGPSNVVLRGTSFWRHEPPTVQVAIERQDIERYSEDGWEICDLDLSIVAFRALPIFDGEVGLVACLSSENFKLSEAGKMHTGGGRFRGYVLVNARWRALDLDSLVDRQNYYEQGRHQMMAFERVLSLLRRMKGIELVFRDGAFRPVPQAFDVQRAG